MLNRTIRAVFRGICVLLGLCAVSWAGTLNQSLESPTDADIRARQTLGRAVASPDGRFFLYEWKRPYNWARNFDALPMRVANHMQTWLYRVDTTVEPAHSEYIFYPESGGSYWLGALSPDAKKISFFVLGDENKIKAGVYDLEQSKFVWLEPAVDPMRVDRLPAWASNVELVYFGPSATPVRANLTTGKTVPCSTCRDMLARAASADSDSEKSATPSEIGPDARLLARSQNGGLAVYAKESSDAISLIFRKGTEKTQTVFENKKHQ